MGIVILSFRNVAGVDNLREYIARSRALTIRLFRGIIRPYLVADPM
jgi:hypothetical protein